MAELKILEKQQPIPKESLGHIQDFLNSLAAKDVRAFSLSFVTRSGDKINFCAGAKDNYSDLLAAVDYGRHRIIAGGDE